MGKIMFNGVEYGGGSGGSSGGEIIPYDYYPLSVQLGSSYSDQFLIDTNKYKRIGVYYYDDKKSISG